MARRRRQRYEQVALEEGQRAGVRNPYAFLRQMRQEAAGRDVSSLAGAQGPAQIMPGTARAWGLNPAQVHGLRSSYRAAATHMADYERQYGSTRDALVAYNAGPGRVGGPLPAETQDYLRRILPNGEKVVRGRPAGRRASAPTRRPLAIPGAPSTRTVTSDVFDQEGYDKAVRRQKVAQLLQHSGRRNSILFRSGLLSPDVVDPQTFTSAQTTTQTVPGVPRIPAGGLQALADAGASADDVRKALHAARKRLGIAETNGTNRGPEVDKMQRTFGMVGQAWCGIYLGTVLREAGVDGVDSRVASVAEIEKMARNREGAFAGGWHSTKHARRGDALITRQGTHVAFVERVDKDGTIHVIGGNQGTGAVTRGTWRPEQVYGIARPSYKRR